MEIAGRVVALGVTESSISTITEFRDKEEVDFIKTECSRAAAVVPQKFSSQLNRMFDKLSMSSSPDMPADSYSGFIQEQKDRLKKMGGLKQ